MGENNTQKSDDPSKVPSSTPINLAIYLIFLTGGLITALILLWPDVWATGNNLLDKMEFRFLFISCAAGGLGSTLILLITFADFASKGQTFQKSWRFWYYIRPITGITTGLLVYAAVRGGILKVDSSVDVLNPYTVVAISALAGLGSRQIIDKLRKLADKLLRTEVAPEWEGTNTTGPKNK